VSVTVERIDPVTFEVIRHKLWSINEEGSATMIHVSGSPVVHATDFNFGLYTAEGEMAVIGVYLLVPIYTGYMAIREFIERFHSIEPGDVFIINDPYIAAEHQNDVQFCAPFFHDGELISWIGCMAHQVDLGGMDPGSWCPTATDVYQEGLRIPPGKIVRRGERNEELWDIIVANSRMPFTVSNDFTAFLAGLKVAGERLHELCERYGGATVAQVMQQSIERSEEGLRDLLRSLPDGEFQHVSYLDRPAVSGSGSTELVQVRCKMTKADDRLVFDFNGSDPQSAAYGMATRAGTIGAVATLVLAVFGSEQPWNHGLMRPVEVVADDGLCVTAIPPTPVSGGAAGANWVAMNAAAACIAKLVSFSERYESLAFGPGDGSWQLAQFGGLNQYGEPFANMYLDSLLWGGPAFSFRDGVDSGGAMVILGGGTEDVEQQEVRCPLLYLWRREVPDSGGAGRNRGGNGIEFAMTPIDTEEVVGVMATHGVALPNRTGIFGGYPGSCASYELVRNSDLDEWMASRRPVTRLDELRGDYEVLPAVSRGIRVGRNEVVNIMMQNGGGYGDPLDREPERVLADVVGRGVSADWAERLYGVVVRDGKLDAAATDARRQAARQARRDRMEPGRSSVSSRISALPGHMWGESLSFDQDGDSVAVSCKHCGTRLGALTQEWQELVGVVDLDASELGPHVRLPPELRARQYVCPECVASLWVEVEPADEQRWHDFVVGAARGTRAVETATTG
jgi:N-methylhydantoinase B